MASITQEQQVAALANSMMLLVAQLNGPSGTLAQIQAINTAWTQLSAANKLNAFPTAAATTTGALGTADVTPVVSNPINVGVNPGTELLRGISANNLASINTYLQGIAAALQGSAVSANGAAPQLVALCL